MVHELQLGAATGGADADSVRHGSEDGAEWRRPAVGQFEFRGSADNNIVMLGYGHHDLYSPSVLRDDRDPDPQRRDKMIWWDFPTGLRGYQDDGMCVAFSPDGVQWTKHAGNPVLHAKKQERSISDVMSVMYDSLAEKFVAYTKGWADPWPAVPAGCADREQRLYPLVRAGGRSAARVRRAGSPILRHGGLPI